MAHFAKLDDNNVVLDVNVVNNDVIDNLPFPESEPIGVQFLTEWSGGYTNWKQTSYNNNFRLHYAHIGGYYDPVKDVFVAPQPYPSWVLNQDTMEWESSVSYPTDGKMYIWDEPTLSWIYIP